jgi:hypothetical protein
VALIAALLVAERAQERVGRERGTAPGADAIGAGPPADAIGPCRVRRVVDGDTARLRSDGEER